MERSKREDGSGARGGSGSGGARGGPRGRVSDFCVRLRGLPWEATKVVL